MITFRDIFSDSMEVILSFNLLVAGTVVNT